jgi:DNA (cytosine-5)-methyltransferase 1
MVTKMNPTVISLFAGCGGSSLGYHMAGFKELLAVDSDEKCATTFDLNFPDTPFWAEDIRKVSGVRVLKECRIARGELDVLDASPPCQGYSIARGGRYISDERNDLFLEFIRFIRSLNPKAYLMENVAGLIQGKMKGMFWEIIRALEKLPYKMECRLLNASNYNVPQKRRRLIWIGVRNDLNRSPAFPGNGTRPLTAGEAIAGCKDKTPVHPMSAKAKSIWMRAKPGKMKGLYGFQRRKIDPFKVAPTVSKMRGCLFYHWNECRELSLEEYAALCSFPKEFKWPNPRTGKEQMGNAVPPRMMEAIALTIRKEVLRNDFIQ